MNKEEIYFVHQRNWWAMWTSCI